MKLLRKTIRRILAENYEESYPTIMRYLNGTKKDVMHALELADTLGLIRIVYEDRDRGGSMHHIHFECLEPNLREYIRKNKLSRRENPMVWWRFPQRYPTQVEMKIQTNGDV